MEVGSDNLVGELSEGLDLVGWERISLLRLRLDDGLGDVAVVEGGLLFLLLSLFLGSLAGGGDLCS